MLLRACCAFASARRQVIPCPPRTAAEERQEARRALLAKETKLLQTINRLKAVAAPVVRAERDAAMLAALAAPRIWRLADGRTIQVATPETLRARELAAAHAALVAADGSSLDARLAALLVAKYHAKAVDCRRACRGGACKEGRAALGVGGC